MFATPWMTARGDRRAAGRKRAWILTSSLVLHGMALATLSGFQAWQVPAIAEPPIADVFVVQLPLPTLPAAPPHHESKADSPPPRSAKPAAETPKTPLLPAPRTPAAVQPDPRTIPEHVPAPATDSPPADPQPGPTDDGGPFGTGRHGNGNGSDGPGIGKDDGPLPIGGPISRPQIVPGTRVEPRYTEIARQAHVQGVVILLAVIDERGNVVDVRVEKSLRFGLDEEAVKAVSQWKFTPGLLNGHPVKVYFDVTVQFQIR
jgi:TonB family protein